MGDHFLSTPEIVSASPLLVEDCDNCTITTPVASTVDSTPIWNTITPETPVQEPSEFPWWLGVLGVAALIVLFYFISSSGQSAA